MAFFRVSSTSFIGASWPADPAVGQSYTGADGAYILTLAVDTEAG